MTLCATSSYTLDIALACSITQHIFILVNSLSVLKFSLSGKLLQTVKLLTCGEEHHPVEPLLFSPRTINYTQNANPMTDCGMYSTVFTAATIGVLTGAPELQNMTTVSLTE